MPSFSIRPRTSLLSSTKHLGRAAKDTTFTLARSTIRTYVRDPRFTHWQPVLMGNTGPDSRRRDSIPGAHHWQHPWRPQRSRRGVSASGVSPWPSPVTEYYNTKHRHRLHFLQREQRGRNVLRLHNGAGNAAASCRLMSPVVGFSGRRAKLHERERERLLGNRRDFDRRNYGWGNRNSKHLPCQPERRRSRQQRRGREHTSRPMRLCGTNFQHSCAIQASQANP